VGVRTTLLRFIVEPLKRGLQDNTKPAQVYNQKAASVSSIWKAAKYVPLFHYRLEGDSKGFMPDRNALLEVSDTTKNRSVDRLHPQQANDHQAVDRVKPWFEQYCIEHSGSGHATSPASAIGGRSTSIQF
jgi:hypothetical protein